MELFNNDQQDQALHQGEYPGLHPAQQGMRPASQQQTCYQRPRNEYPDGRRFLNGGPPDHEQVQQGSRNGKIQGKIPGFMIGTYPIIYIIIKTNIYFPILQLIYSKISLEKVLQLKKCLSLHCKKYFYINFI